MSIYNPALLRNKPPQEFILDIFRANTASRIYLQSTYTYTVNGGIMAVTSSPNTNSCLKILNLSPLIGATSIISAVFTQYGSGAGWPNITLHELASGIELYSVAGIQAFTGAETNILNTPGTPTPTLTLTLNAAGLVQLLARNGADFNLYFHASTGVAAAFSSTNFRFRIIYMK